MPIAVFDSTTIPQDRRTELEAAVVAAGKQLSKRFEGWIVAAPARAEGLPCGSHHTQSWIFFRAIRMECDCATERVRVAMPD
jgi:hypothetical protein